MCKTTKHESRPEIANSDANVIFVGNDIKREEKEKVRMFISIAKNMVSKYFCIKPSTFDLVICRGSWEMEIQVISRIKGKLYSLQSCYDITKSVAITDNHLKEIVVRYDAAKFGHYLHELIHAAISKNHTHQMREGLAWYFTIKLLEQYKYTMPKYPKWVDELYINPVKVMADFLGIDFLKDFATGNGSILEEALPIDIQDLFLPEEVFYAKRRRFVR